MSHKPSLFLALGMLFLAFASLSATAQQVIATVQGVPNPFAEAINPTTNKVYVADEFTHTVTVIDGSSLTTTPVTVGDNPYSIALNATTNKIYVGNLGDATVTVIDGSTLATQTVTIGASVTQLAVNPATNKVYVTNGAQNTLTIIDGTTLALTTVPTGLIPGYVAVNSTTNKIYVVNGGNGGQSSVTVVDGVTLATQNVLVGYGAFAIAIDDVRNKVYVTNECGSSGNCDNGTVTVIDGATLSTTTVSLTYFPYTVAVNPVTNMIYVANADVGAGTTVTVINGTTLATQTVQVGQGPYTVAVNPATNKVFVTGSTSQSVTVIDGATNYTIPIPVGNEPQPVVIDTQRNRAYVGNFGDGTVSVIAYLPQQFAATTPCRVVDTRNNGGPIQGGTTRSFPVLQSNCGIPPAAEAFSLNVTVVPQGPLGYLTIWPTGDSQPLVSTLNSPDGRVKANAAIVRAGLNGAVSVYVTDTANVILDIDGYFEPSTPQTLQFYPLVPCRVVDTRQTNFPPGLGAPSFGDMETRELPVYTNSPCLNQLTVAPQAYSFNVTAVPYPAGQPLNYLTIWPSDEPMPGVSTLNNPTATVVANAAIVPADQTNGDVSVFTYNSTDVIIDVNGYFAAAGTGGYNLYPVAPCRAYDSRNNNGQPFMGERTVPIATSPCAPPANAAAYIFNATVVPSGAMPYLTLWPDMEQQPMVSTLNAYDGIITSNMAIVPNIDGSIDTYAAGLTQLILDISGYFAQ